MYPKWHQQSSLKLEVLLTLLTILCPWSEEVSVSTCQWTVSPDGRMSCHMTYIRNNRELEGQPVSSKAVCRWPNSTDVTLLLSKLQKVIVFCDYESAVGLPIMDSETFLAATNLEEIDIRNTPLRSTLPPDTFCNLPKLRTLAMRRIRLENMDHIGLGDGGRFDSRCVRTDLKQLWLSLNQIRMIRNREPLSGMTQLDTLGLDDNLLEDIHPEAFADLVNLDSMFLLNNSLTQLAPGTFKTLKRLTLLDISSNRLTTIVPGTFEGLDNLTNLALEKNRLTSLADGTFTGMGLLLSLELSRNNIVDIAENAFASLKSLLILDLNDNEITELPSKNVFGELEILRELDLSRNYISTIDIVMESLPALEKFRVDSNRLTTLSSGIFQKQNKLKQLKLNDNLIERIAGDAFSTSNVLENLFLRGNRLTDIPDLRRFQRLQELDLSNNLISDVSRQTFLQTTELRRLSLRGNRLHTLGDNIFQNLQWLNNLDLADNRMELVGNDTFAGLNNLENLQMENNQLNFSRNIYTYNTGVIRTSRMLDVFRNIGKLIKANFSGNGIDDFQYFWFSAGLKDLDLSRNAIKDVNGPIVRFPVPTLQSLSLSHNVIDKIEPGSFPLTLKHLQLDDNLMTGLDNKTFQYMRHLISVSLQRNRIETINIPGSYFVEGVRIPVRFRLEGNPLVCDCRLDWIRANNKGANFEIVDADKLTCERGFDKWERRISVAARTLDKDYFLCAFATTVLVSRSCRLTGTEGWDFCIYTCPLQCRCYRNVDWLWITLDCSTSNLIVVPADLPLATTVLYLDGNDMNRIGTADLAWLSSLQRLYLNNNVIEVLEPDSFANLANLKVLHLDHNALTKLSDETLFANLKHLVTLDLSHNRLTNLSERIFKPLIKLEMLNLANNLLVNYPVWVLETLPALSDVGLYANPWSCDCEYAWSYREWIGNFTGRLTDKGNLYCVKDDGATFVSLITFNVSDCYEGTVRVDSVTTVLVSSISMKLAWLATFPIILIVVCIMIFVYRSEMQVLIYSHYGMRLFHKSDEQYDADKVYDGFVSYSTLDEEFVVRQLLPGLEGIANPYSLCLHHRDFPIGAFINESIFDSIAKSRRTILILTENFVRSEWCRFEFRTAHSQMLLDRCKRVIVIVFGDIPENLDAEMKLYLRTNTYLVWGDRLFWKKLYFVLPEQQHREQ